eukprot:10633720-Heterocapsa_arctica.AAC.1
MKAGKAAQQLGSDPFVYKEIAVYVYAAFPVSNEQLLFEGQGGMGFPSMKGIQDKISPTFISGVIYEYPNWLY